MTLIITHNPNRAIVRHADGTEEVFTCRSAAIAIYPELAPPPMTKQQERKAAKAQRTGRERDRGLGGRFV